MNITNFLNDYFEENIILNHQEIELPVISEDGVKLDIVLNEKIIKRIWGYVRDHNSKPIPRAQVSLLRHGYIRGCLKYMPVNNTFTDEVGFYQFTLENDKCHKEFKIAIILEK